MTAGADTPGAKATPPPRPPLTEAQQRLVSQWSGLPANVAGKLLSRGSDLHPAKNPLYDPMVSEGMLALCLCSQSFDPSWVSEHTGRPVAFSTYAMQSVWRAERKLMLRLLAHAGPEELHDSLADPEQGEVGEQFGELQHIVDRLPEAERIALARGDEQSPAYKRALSLLRAEVATPPDGDGAASGPHRGWTAGEEGELIRAHRAGLLGTPADEEALAARLGKTPKAVRRRIARLREIGALNNVAKADEEAWLVTLAHGGGLAGPAAVEGAARHLHRSPKGLAALLRQMADAGKIAHGCWEEGYEPPARVEAAPTPAPEPTPPAPSAPVVEADAPTPAEAPAPPAQPAAPEAPAVPQERQSPRPERRRGTRPAMMPGTRGDDTERGMSISERILGRLGVTPEKLNAAVEAERAELQRQLAGLDALRGLAGVAKARPADPKPPKPAGRRRGRPKGPGRGNRPGPATMALRSRVIALVVEGGPQSLQAVSGLVRSEGLDLDVGRVRERLDRSPWFTIAGNMIDLTPEGRAEAARAAKAAPTPTQPAPARTDIDAAAAIGG